MHKLEADGTLEHFEYLAHDFADATQGLVTMLSNTVGPVGDIVVSY